MALEVLPEPEPLDPEDALEPPDDEPVALEVLPEPEPLDPEDALEPPEEEPVALEVLPPVEPVPGSPAEAADVGAVVLLQSAGSSNVPILPSSGDAITCLIEAGFSEYVEPAVLGLPLGLPLGLLVGLLLGSATEAVWFSEAADAEVLSVLGVLSGRPSAWAGKNTWLAISTAPTETTFAANIEVLPALDFWLLSGFSYT